MNNINSKSPTCTNYDVAKIHCMCEQCCHRVHEGWTAVEKSQKNKKWLNVNIFGPNSWKIIWGTQIRCEVRMLEFLINYIWNVNKFSRIKTSAFCSGEILCSWHSLERRWATKKKNRFIHYSLTRPLTTRRELPSIWLVRKHWASRVYKQKETEIKTKNEESRKWGQEVECKKPKIKDFNLLIVFLINHSLRFKNHYNMIPNQKYSKSQLLQKIMQ